LADRGITFDGDVTFIYQGVADGGVNQTFNYAGHGDYLLGFDFEKMGVHDGLSLQLRAEHRWGEFLAADAGLISPQNLITTSFNLGSLLCQRITLPMRYEQATNTTAANEVALLRIKSGK
jgi:hypothetical protein